MSPTFDRDEMAAAAGVLLRVPSYATLARFVRGIAEYERYATRDSQEDEAKAHKAILHDIEHEARRLAGDGMLDAAIDEDAT